MKIGILTSGGDAPGMNAAIRAVVKAAGNLGIEVYGIKHGFKGLLNEDLFLLDNSMIDSISEIGGTVLKTARCTDFMNEKKRQEVPAMLEKYDINSVIVIGGDGSLAGAEKLSQLGINVIGLPATIDNDMSFTDFSIGFDTTLNTVLDCIGKVKHTNASHDKTTIIEVMGRACGDLALYSALAGGGEIVSTPENILSDTEICNKLEVNINNGKKDNVIIITEKLYDLESLKAKIEKKLKLDIRTTVLGFVQRGGVPSAFDRVLSNKLGAAAVRLLASGNSGSAVGIKNNKVIEINLKDINKLKPVKKMEYELLEMLL